MFSEAVFGDLRAGRQAGGPLLLEVGKVLWLLGRRGHIWRLQLFMQGHNQHNYPALYCAVLYWHDLLMSKHGTIAQLPTGPRRRDL